MGAVQEAFDKTGRILNIPVKAIDQIDDTRKVHVRMLNYLTAPHVVVWSASRASCSVPGVYAPFPLLARDPDGSLRYEGQDSHDDHFEPTLYVDGSMGADLPIETMKAMFNCDHFICSQVNAHAAILGDSALRLTGAEAPGVLEDRVSLRTCRETPGVEDAALAGLAFLKHQLKAWVAAGARFCATLQLGRAATAIGADLIPWQLGGWGLALLTQPYEGRPEDVTIVPWAGHLSLFGSVLSSLTNATGDGALRLEAVLDAGERNTWRELPKIRDHCAVEVALETGVQRLRRSLLAARRSGSPQTASLGRTPSFYTSPSLLQLSGLNVVDPALNRSADPDSPPSSGEDGFVEVPKQRPRSQSESGPILKSMHMANFYYRHSNRSSRSLNSQRSVSEQSSLDVQDGHGQHRCCGVVPVTARPQLPRPSASARRPAQNPPAASRRHRAVERDTEQQHVRRGGCTARTSGRRARRRRGCPDNNPGRGRPFGNTMPGLWPANVLDG